MRKKKILEGEGKKGKIIEVAADGGGARGSPSCRPRHSSGMREKAVKDKLVKFTRIPLSKKGKVFGGPIKRKKGLLGGGRSS